MKKPSRIRPSARYFSGDQLHTGTVFGKLGGKAEEVLGDNKAMPESNIPCCSGVLHPGKAAAEVRTLYSETVLQSGGGIHKHPDGTNAGARAMVQVVDTAFVGIDTTEDTKTHIELRKALEKWGTK